MTLHDRIRAVVEERLRIAREACHDGSGRWHQRAAFEDDPEWLSPRVDDENGEVVVYDEGAPLESEAAHIAANDPADAILSAEHALGILERHQDVGGDCDACFKQPEWGDHGGMVFGGYVPIAECQELLALATRWRVEVDG